MSWNDCLYRYYKEHIGQYLGGREEDALLILTWRGRPLAVDLYRESGRYGAFYHVQARIAVELAKSYELIIGARKPLAGGLNTILKVAPAVANYAADLGYPEITQKRLIRTNYKPFTRQVLSYVDFRNALLSCPEDKVEIRPGPGEDGVHLITVTTEANISAAANSGGGWELGQGASDTYTQIYGSQEEKDKLTRRIEETFFPRMDRFLDLARTAYNAVTQWPM